MLLQMFRKIILNKNLYQSIVCKNLFKNTFYKYSTFCDVDKSMLNNYIRILKQEYDNINNTSTKITDNGKRLNELTPIMHILKQRDKLTEQLASIKELLKDNDEEMKKLALEESELYKNKINDIEDELIESLIPVDTEDFCDSILLEVNAGVGGQEAMLFAKEIFDMYCNFSDNKGWNYQFVDYDPTDIGGIRHASMFVNGNEVYKYFKYEAGVHRVQRIPTTERSGRVHTSTVSVVALPQPKDIDITIHDKDLRIETKRSSGAGGQHVNTTDSAVRIVHLPTGTNVECQVDRSQIKNREIAMQKLRALLYEKQLSEQIADAEATRKSQVRTKFRNEKIRTYNYSQDRITDHRLQGSNFHNLKVFLLGGEPLETLINKLHNIARYKQLLDIISSVK